MSRLTRSLFDSDQARRGLLQLLHAAVSVPKRGERRIRGRDRPLSQGTRRPLLDTITLGVDDPRRPHWRCQRQDHAENTERENGTTLHAHLLAITQRRRKSVGFWQLQDLL